MSEPSTEGLTAEERIRAELRSLRAEVSGVHGSMIATTDGFLVAHDITDLEPTGLAALVATTLGLARQTTQATGRGQFREAVVRGGDGYLAVYALGDDAVIAVIGTNELNIGMLHYQTRDLIKRIASLYSEAGRAHYGRGLMDGSFRRG